MTRDEARRKFQSSGIAYKSLTRPRLQRLRCLINEAMKKSGCFDNTYRCRQRPIVVDKGKFRAWINCKSFYFDDREAVTFNSDGFVGFAGWADDKNVQPILVGFSSWVDEMAHRVTR